MTVSNIRQCLGAAVFLLTCLAPLAGTAGQDADAPIRESLVFVKVSGLAKSEPANGVRLETMGTGFLVSEDGLVLTNYHILTKLGDVVPQSVEFSTAIGDKSAQVRPAATVDGAPLLDLLLLKMPPAPQPYVPVVFGSAYELPTGAEIFTSGFPKSLSYRKRSGFIEAHEGPSGYLWSVTMSFQSGESGSPVYDADAG